MTNQEAIERIETHMRIHGYAEKHAVYITEALQMAIKALRTMDALGPLREAFESAKIFDDGLIRVTPAARDCIVERLKVGE